MKILQYIFFSFSVHIILFLIIHVAIKGLHILQNKIYFVFLDFKSNVQCGFYIKRLKHGFNSEVGPEFSLTCHIFVKVNLRITNSKFSTARSMIYYGPYIRNYLHLMPWLLIQNTALFLIGSNPMTYFLTGFAETWLQKFLSNFSWVFFTEYLPNTL